MLNGFDHILSTFVLASTLHNVCTLPTRKSCEALRALSVKACSITLRCDAWMFRSVSAWRLFALPAEASITVYHRDFWTLPCRLAYILVTASTVLNESVFGPMRTTEPTFASAWFPVAYESNNNTPRTVLLMIFEQYKMPVPRGGTVRVGPICDSGEQKTWVLGQWMQCKTIIENAHDDLERRRILSTFEDLDYDLLSLTKLRVAILASRVLEPTAGESRGDIILRILRSDREMR